MLTDPFPLARSGPLVPALGIILVAAAFALALVVAGRPAVRSRWSWLRPEIGALAALSLLHLLFFWQPYRTPALVPRGGGDLASFFYPMHAFAARVVQDGSLPFWNPYLFSGAPHLANFQTGALYPLNLIAYLLADPFSYATLELLAIGHFLIASYGAYWLARTIGMSRVGGVLAGAIYAYSGFLVAHLGHYPMLVTASWAPFVLAAIVATVRRNSWFIACLGALALALAVLGGHQPILLLTLTGAAAVAVFEVWRISTRPRGLGNGDQRSHYRRLLLETRNAERGTFPRALAHGLAPKLAFMAIIALGLTAPAIAPMFELTTRTVRSELSYARATEFSVEPVALIHLVAPTVFGSNPTDYWGAFSNTEMWGYTGVLALALAAYGFAVRPTRTRAFWLVTAVVALLFLLGPFTAIHGWAYAFAPGYDRIRGAGRAYMFFDLAVALLAGFGLDALLRARSRWSPQQVAITKWGIVGLAGALAIVVGFVIPLFASRVLVTEGSGNRPVIALDNANLLALWLALGIGVALAAWRGALRGVALAVAVFAVVLLDLFHATAPFNPTTDDLLAGFRHEQAVEFLRERYAEDGPFRIEVMTGAWQPNLALLAGLDDIGGLYDPLGIEAYTDYVNRAVADRTSDAYESLGARYVIGDTSQTPPAGYEEALRTDDGVVIWEAPEWRPLAWIEGSDAPVIVEEIEPGGLELRLPEDAAGETLVISQIEYPGWTATAGGREVAIEPWNGALQAIDLPPGVRTVELSFRPTYWTLWLAISAASAMAWLGVFGLSVTAWRRRPAPEPGQDDDVVIEEQLVTPRPNGARQRRRAPVTGASKRIARPQRR